MKAWTGAKHRKEEKNQEDIKNKKEVLNHKFNIEPSRSIDFILVRRFGPWTFLSHKTGVESHNSSTST